MLINEYKWRNGFQRVPVDRWKAGIGIGYDRNGGDQKELVKRPNSGTLFPPFILRIQISLEMTVRFGIGRKWC